MLSGRYPNRKNAIIFVYFLLHYFLKCDSSSRLLEKTMLMRMLKKCHRYRPYLCVKYTKILITLFKLDRKSGSISCTNYFQKGSNLPECNFIYILFWVRNQAWKNLRTIYFQENLFYKYKNCSRNLNTKVLLWANPKKGLYKSKSSAVVGILCNLIAELKGRKWLPILCCPNRILPKLCIS